MSLMQIAGGTVFDATHGEVIRNGVVCLEDDRITAVGPASAIAIGGRDVQVIDAVGQFVMPGMMDCHVHLLSSIEDGLVPGPRIYAAGHSLSVPGGHGDSYFRPEVHVECEGLINGLEAAR